MAHQTDVQSPSKKLESKLKKSKDSTKEEGSADAQESTPSKKDAKSDKKDKKKRKSVSEDATPETDGELKKKKKRRHSEDDNDENGKDESHKQKKKRVSFGPGTKEFDGDSESESDEADSNDAVATDGADADVEDAGDLMFEEMKEHKRNKKKQRKNGTADIPIHETAILSYLSQYHRARATWKFQKNRETNLFKHIYSLEEVPSKYNTSLLAYMQGLKGDAAKQRMSDAARLVIKADMDLDKPKEDEEAEGQEPKGPSLEYLEAINAFRECLPTGSEDLDNVNFGEKLEGDVQKRLPKRQRAELVFFAVAGKLFSAEDLKKPKKPRAAEPPVNKKRKNRTMVVDISSSEDSDDDAPAPKKAVSKPAPDSDDETSSSGSSSDSDSDSDKKPSAPRAPAKQSAANTPSSSAPNGGMSKKEAKAAKRKEKFVPVREEKLKPAVPKKTQKRKLRTAQIEISSSESDSE
ncbi:Protein of unknown function DUF2373 [Penicillium concentricum]|uniref:WKF domain-containing protein n=1 Tax=Penicillium concentricum TaxID=293559 RepID=A0A9W9SQF0_9EURO|nr:Protein of unknown function DUF2373 [Penicillium concentricum]KAJ5382743.1 Protein of unknown function DUF2373 [Penicillium concentricum]